MDEALAFVDAAGRDDAVGQRVIEAERVTDHADRLADLDRIRVAELDEYRRGHLDAQQREVGLGIAGEQLDPGVLGAVEQLDLHLAGVANHVMVGGDGPVGGDEEAGAARVKAAVIDLDRHHRRREPGEQLAGGVLAGFGVVV